MRILVVEDDELLAEGMLTAIRRGGWAVDRVATGKEAIAVCDIEHPGIVVLDLGLPDMDGLRVLKHIRHKKFPIQTMILTARDAIDDKVAGLDAGADDYLTKPFDVDELLARLRVLERRLGTADTAEITIGDIILNTSTNRVSRCAETLALSRREYMLLKALMENAGSILTRESLESRLYSWGEEIASNALDVHIHNLRKKVGNEFIQTIRGMGYMVNKASAKKTLDQK
jgi:DNA-binding response OmpR family regulator